MLESKEMVKHDSFIRSNMLTKNERVKEKFLKYMLEL